MDLNQVTISEKLKRIAAYRGYTVKSLGDEFNRRYGTRYTQSSFSRKFNNPKIGYDELKQLGEILNFEIDFKLIDSPMGE